MVSAILIHAMTARLDTVKVPALRFYRSGKLMTQIELAAAAGISEMTVVRAERGESCTFTVVKKMARALEVDPTQLTEEARCDG